MNAEERSLGVVAFSSGNHARGVAIAARRLGIQAIIVMPSDAPTVKIEATRGEGAQIVFYDRKTESREAIAASLAHERGATLVPSFDDAAIVSGQGTVGLEILEQLRDLGEPAPRRIVVPCGGGGLTAGIALACPDASIVAVEPEGWDDMGRSLAMGTIEPVAPDAPPTLCDSLQTPRVSPITFCILQERSASAAIASEAEVQAAVRFAWRELGEVVEPGGAVGLAALLAGRLPPMPGTVAVLSGGNIDPALHARIVA
jgi:threonine dehydratase